MRVGSNHGRRSPAGIGRRVAACVAVGLLLVGCTAEPFTPAPVIGDRSETKPEEVDYARRKTIFGEGGIMNLFGSPGEQDKGGGALGVNSFLWRASLDTISFMPVNSADPFGGVIITDWHTPVESPSERFKLNVYILGRTLRADGIRVAVFRQIQDRAGQWKDAAVPDETGVKIEDAILIRARQLRNQTIEK